MGFVMPACRVGACADLVLEVAASSDPISGQLPNHLQLGGGAVCDTGTSHRAETFNHSLPMKNLLRSSIAAAIASLALTTAVSAADTEAGAIDIGQLMPSAKG